MSPNVALAWLRRRWWVAVALVAFLFFAVWLSQSALGEASERRATRDYLVECTTPGPNPPPVTGHDCYDRSLQSTGRAVADIRRSIDCAALYAIGERPPACADVTERMDAIRDGGNPFSESSPSPQPPAPPIQGKGEDQ